MDLRQTGAVFRGVKVGVAKSRFKFQALAVCAALMTFATTCWGQTTAGYLDFGTSTSGTAATTSNTGFGGVRTGSGGGGWTIQNVGQSIGTAGELRGIAPTGGSVNSVGITSTEFGTGSTTFTIAFELYLSGGSSGTWSFFAGNGTSFAAAQSTAFTGSQVFTGIQWIFGASGGITANNRAVSAWSAISGTPFAQNTAYQVVIVGNNSASTVNYGASNAYSVAAYKYDLWVNGTLVGNDLGKAQLPDSTAINAFRFYGESSAANVATIALDNVRWYTSCVLPPTHLVFAGVPSTGTEGSSISQYTVGVRSGSTTGPVANSFTGPVTVSKASGSGAISGTLSPNAVAGTATFSDTVFSAADTYTITATAVAPIAAAPGSGNIVISAAPTAPSTQATSFTSSSVTSSGATVGWTRGNGTGGVLVVARAGGAVNQDPTDGTNYTANATFGSGTQIGTGNWVVYKGTGTSVNVTSLSPSTTYHFAIYDYNTSGTMHNMTELTGNITTIAAAGTLATGTSSLSALTATTYGAASASANFTVTGSGLDSSGVTVTPPAGFEVSGTSNFESVGTSASPLSLGTSATLNTTVYVRLAATAVPGSYSGNISVAGGGASTKTVSIASSTVNTKALTVTGAAVTSKTYDGTTAATITGTLSGIEGSDSVSLTGTGTFDSANAGSGKSVTSTSTLGGTHAARYTLTQPTGLTGTITKASQTITGVASTATQTVGATYALSATVDSGLTLSYSSSNTGVATVDASGNVTVVGAGSATLTVSQAGDSNYNSATSVTQVLTATVPPVYLHDFGTATLTSKPYTASPVRISSNLSNSSWTTSASAFGDLAGSAGKSLSLSDSSGSPTLTLTFDVTAGYQLDVSGLSFWRQRSNTGAQNISLTINGGAAVYTGTVPTSGANIGTQTVTGKTGLTGTITVVLTMSGASGTGTFRLDDFTLEGSVSVIPPTITINSGTSATATAFTTTYGTPAIAQTFTVAGSNLTADVTATAPTGFEVSSDGTTYGSTATFTRSGGGTSASGTLRVRLAATAGVGGSYNSQTIELASTGATTRNITTAASGNTVSAKGLTITGLTAQNKNWDGTTTATVTGTPAYSGLVNGESFSITDAVTWTFPDANVGTTKTLTRAGSFSAPSANYNVTQPTLTANISALVASAPTIDSITAGNGQLSVAFSAPSSNGGAAVSNYEYSLNGGGSWTARSPANTASPLIITSLTNGTPYDVQIRAVNSAGGGTASSTVQGTPVAPAVPTITLSKASLAAKTTTYGTPSSAETFTVSGVTLTGDNLTVTAPAGFEVSTNGTTFSSSVNLPIVSGAVSETTIHARLAATAAVTGSFNSQNITVSGGNAGTQNLATASSGNSVTVKTLTITGLNSTTASKTYDGTTTANVTGTAVYTGLTNGENFEVLDTVTWAFADANVGSGKSLSRTGSFTAPTSNYSIPTQPTLTADITQATTPTLIAAVGATVDNAFEVTFTETSSLWRSSITSITVGGTTLSASAYDTTASGKITFNPGLSALLQSSGSKSIVVVATGHSNGTVTQSVGAGAAVQLSVFTQPTAPSANGGTLAAQPVIRLLDLYNNVTTSTANVTAAATQGTWTLGGTTTVAAVNGTATFSGLTAASAAAVTGATITFSSSGLTGATSSTFNILAPPAANDGTSTAIALTVDATASSGSFAGSTPTFSPTSTLNDVWYKFIATSTSHALTVAGAAGTDPDIRVYEGTGSPSFSTAPTAYTTPTPLVIGQLAGVTEETVIATNFVVGRTYFVMVQDDGNTGGSFTIRVRTASASIATWNPTWSGTAASPLAATSKDTNLDSGSLARVGLTGSSSSSRYSSSGWNSTANYLTVTLAAATGYRMDLNDGVLYGNWAISGTTGPGWFEVRSSVDNYASILGYFDVSTSSSGILGAIKLPSSGYSGLSSVTFRILSNTTQFSGTGSVASTATAGPVALRVTGAIVQIPGVTAATVAGTVGTAVDYSIVASGSPTSYAISSGTLPTGLSLNTTTGAITGTPTTAATGTVVGVTASNSAGTSASANLTFNIAKATPIISAAPAASAINYGQTLASSELTGGTGSVAGTFAFTTPSTAPNAGTASQNVTFTPTDGSNYNTASTTVSVTVNTKAITVTADAKSKAYGAADPGLTYAITTEALVVGDSLTGGLSRAAGENVGTYAISSTLANANYDVTFVPAYMTITAATLVSGDITMTPAGDGSYTASATGGASFTYSYAGRTANGITTSYSSATAPTVAGYYTVSATATGNYSGSNTADYFVAGPVAVDDPTRTKSAGNTAQLIPISELLANDRRITSTGTVETTGLAVTGVTNGSGNTEIAGVFIQFIPSSASTDTFTYTLSDGTKSATGTVTVTTETQAPSFDLQIVKVGTAAFAGGNTTVTHDFIGVPGQTYLVEYKGDLAEASWTSAGAQSTGSTGSFSVTFTKAGDHTTDWNGSMFFQARRQ